MTGKCFTQKVSERKREVITDVLHSMGSVWLCELICAGTQRFLYINWFLWVLDLNVFKPLASRPSVKHPQSLSRAPSLAHFSYPLSGLPHCLASLLLPSVLCPLPLSFFLSHLEPHIHFRDTLFSVSPSLMHDCILRVTECSTLLITLRLRTSRSDRDRKERIRGKGKSINMEMVKHLTAALHCANNPFQ